MSTARIYSQLPYVAAKQENVMRNVKVGDIAIVVNGGYKREREGMVVKVLSFNGRVIYGDAGLQPMWSVQAYGGRSFGYQDPDDWIEPSWADMPDFCLRRVAPDQAKTDLLDAEESTIKRRKVNPDTPLDLNNLPFDPATAAGEASLRITRSKSRGKK